MCGCDAAVQWDTTGNQRAEGEDDADKNIGDWTFWNEDGSIDEESTGSYENGVKIR